MSYDEYISQLTQDNNFFISEVQLQLATNPTFFDLLIDPYDKNTYVTQKNELIEILANIYEYK